MAQAIEPVNDRSSDVAEYCREIETYLCRKNDGHLIRVVGPSFDRVARWASDGVPMKVAFRGIDRYFERYYRRGKRRRPVKIDFCEADVLDAFDEWRRAVGLAPSRLGEKDAAAPGRVGAPEARRNKKSLTAHLEHTLARLSNARAIGTLGPAADWVLDGVSSELDVSRRTPGGLRGAVRTRAIDRLAHLDAELVALVLAQLDDVERSALEARADEELAAFRQTMAPDSYRRARQAAVASIARERFSLPILAFS